MNSVNVKKNYFFNALYQITNILVPLVTAPYLSRILRADGLGQYSYGYSVAYYFYMFIRLGLHNYGNRTVAYIKGDKQELNKTVSEIYSFQFASGLVILIGYIVYCSMIASNKIIAFIFAIYVVSGMIDFSWLLYGLEEFRIVSIRDIFIKVLTAILIFCFVKNTEDVWKYALIYSAGYFVSQAIALPIIVKQVRFMLPTYDGVIKHIKPNLILFLPTIAVSIYRTMDKIMLGVMSSDTELGFYHSSENIIRVPLALITALGTVMLPRMSNMLAIENDNRKIENIFNKSIAFTMFISTSICMGIMTVSKEFVPVFFGEGFDKCVVLFYIILPSCIFLGFANVIRTQFLLPRKMDKVYISSLFLGAGVNVILNCLLIPKYQSVGAAVGTLVSEIVVCFVQTICVSKEIDICHNLLDSLPYIVSGVLMFVLFKEYTPAVTNQILGLGMKIIISGIFYLIILCIFLLIKRGTLKTKN